MSNRVRGPLSAIVKPWGGEQLLAHTDHYALKRIKVNKGEGSSLQYHNQKEESLYLLSGLLRFEIGPNETQLETVQLKAGDCIDVPTGTVHRTLALEDCDLIEVSTPHLDDVVRLKDKYGR
jgi:mannose-6-phosphate isomerase-like protein (cupin superfamily)